MTTQIDRNNIQPAVLAALTPVTVTQVQITDSSWTVLDDSAVSTSGGYIVITGTNFQAGCNVIINSTNATSVSLVSSTTLRVQVPAMTAGTYVVYVVNTNGGTAIIVNGLTYSGAPTWVTSSPLTTSTAGVAISIQLSATGDAPLTYAVAAGSSLPSGLTLSSGGLLSGTVTGLSTTTTYNFTINAIDAQAQDSPKAFAITISAGDFYWNYVSTLLSASTPVPLPFNDDASTNNFAIAINGDTRPYNSNPYTPGYYSNYFDGSTGKLTLPSSASMSLDAQFTIECWVYWAGTSASYQNFIGSNNTFTSNASFFRVWGTGSPANANKIGIGNPTHDGASSVYSTNSLTPNTWNHVAATRDSSNIIRVFINGTLEKTGSTDTSLYDFGQGGTCIGDSPWDGASGWYTGNISNLRVIKGSCLYTTSFTPSTTPLTAVANTSLLTCQSNRFIDNSTNAATITLTGSVTVKSFIPYTPNSSYSTYGSAYFDGTGDYLTATTGNLGSGDFTVEYWVYYTSLYDFITNVSTTRGSTGWNCGTQSAGQIVWYSSGVEKVRGTTAMKANVWNHVAFVRSGGTLKGYLNGVQDGTTSTETTNFTDTSLGIGRLQNATPGEYFTGYMSNVRLVAGTAVYTTNFTPPASPLTAIANTQLLTCQTNQSVANNTFLDNSTNNSALTRNGNTTLGTFSPYGAGYSIYFNNASYMNALSTSGAYTSIPNTTNFDLGTGDFTIEGWIYPMQLPSGDTWPTNYQNTSSLFGRGTPSTADGYNLVLGATKLLFQSNDTLITSGTHNIAVGNWYHVAVSRTSGTLQLFVNGLSIVSVSYSSSPGAGSNFYIGCETGQGAYFYGYMSNVRLVKGTGLYTATFTPSSTPLQPIAGTQVLTNQTQSFNDMSPNAGVVTATNSPTIQRYSPFNGTTLPTPYYSTYFDNSNYITAADNTALQLGTGDFTIEFWTYRTATQTFYGLFNKGSEYGLDNDASRFIYRIAGGTGFVINGDVDLNAWTHIALVKNGSTTTLYKNGVSLGTSTNVISNSTSVLTVGYCSTGNNAKFPGYITNFRVVKGTAVYTANFTPPTSPLTAISGTSLLTCQSNTLVDNSANNFALTSTGNPTPRAISPFTLSYSTKQQYTQSTIGGSMYFDGGGDYLSSPSPGTIYQFGTSNWTIEAWVYSTSTSSTQTIFDVYGTTNDIINVQFNGTTLAFFCQIRATNQASTTPTSTVLAALNSWNHVAVVRDSTTTIKLYVNGVLGATATIASTTTFVDTQFASNPTVGAKTNTVTNYMVGYISDLRVVKGQALYTSNFVPQNQPLRAVNNTAFLLNGTGSGIYDSSTQAEFETVGDTKLSTTTVKFTGSASIYLDGTGDYLAAPMPPVCLSGELGTLDFTVEYWMNASAAGTYVTVVGTQSIAGNTTAGIWRTGNRFNGANGIYFSYTNGSSFIDLTFTTTNYNDGTWHHVAFTRASGTLRAFVDGTQVGTGQSVTQNLSSGQRIYVGYNVQDSANYTGYISDLRITKGYARYTANFTAPTTPFTTY